MRAMGGLLISMWCLICVATSKADARSVDPFLFFQPALQKSSQEVQSGMSSCCYPPQFRANVFLQQFGFGNSSTEASGTLNVDRIQQRFAVDVTMNNPPMKMREIYLLKQAGQAGVVYMIDDAAKRCSHRPTGITFDESIDPCFNNATYAGFFGIGETDSTDSLLMRSYIRSDSPTWTRRRYVSARRCAPVVDSAKMTIPSGGREMSSMLYYYNVVSRLDESAFVIPPFCGKAETNNWPDALFKNMLAMFPNTESTSNV